mmetsp:Transcript_25928/g.53569  ORF Transcript_25928/g.53569 Transcript_25928/m.53569 type:complete len:142 (-) Transcript_25928:138-563(-)
MLQGELVGCENHTSITHTFTGGQETWQGKEGEKRLGVGKVTQMIPTNVCFWISNYDILDIIIPFHVDHAVKYIYPEAVGMNFTCFVDVKLAPSHRYLHPIASAKWSPIVDRDCLLQMQESLSSSYWRVATSTRALIQGHTS